METTTAGLALRQAAAQECIQIPGAPNALSARLIERYGFPAMYLSHKGLSAADLALPDLGLVTLTELVEQSRRLTAAANVPLLVDAGSGFGDVMQVERTVFELESAGAAGILLEDRLVDANAMYAKLRAAEAARADTDTVIVARTAVRSASGLEAAIERAKRYLDAGAQWLLPTGLRNEDEFSAFADQIEAPLIADMDEFSDSPLLSAAALEQMGYAAVLYPMTLLRVAMRASEAALAMLAGEGHQRELLDLMQSEEELQDLLDHEEFRHRAQAYRRTEEAS